MGSSIAPQFAVPALDAELIAHVSGIVQKIAGIQLGDKQKAMVSARIGKRMLDLGISTPEAYLEHIIKNKESEGAALVSLLTTHHTFFFREFSHFEFLERTGLAQVVAQAKARGDKKISVWSAASSRGQEAYSISMFLAYHLKQIDPTMDYEIFGSDVDPESVAIAKNGVYRWDEIKEAPSIYVGSHFSRGTGNIEAFVKAKDSIKSKCKFDVINLFDLSKVKGKKFDLIFCRNVFIYFTHEQIKEISKGLLQCLHQGGVLFTGMSETLNGLELPVKYLGPSIYGHPVATAPKAAVAVHGEVQGKKATPAAVAPSAEKAPAPEAEKNIRVLCVDDSPTILALLKKILTKEAGFEIVGTAKNGLEASEFLKKASIDVMTLDIHMPDQNGIEYLEKNFSGSHPPVVMLSSASREDSGLGMRSLELGARDYIEKPTLSNLSDKADEIKLKLRCALKIDPSTSKQALDLDRSFQKKTGQNFSADCLRVVILGIGDKEKCAALLKQCSGAQPATVFLIHGPANVLPKVIDGLKPAAPAPLHPLSEGTKELKPGMFYIGDFDSGFGILNAIAAKKNLSTLVFASVGKDILDKLQQLSKPGLILEDIGSQKALDGPYKTIRSKALHFVPYTSFLYHSDDELLRAKK